LPFIFDGISILNTLAGVDLPSHGETMHKHGILFKPLVEKKHSQAMVRCERKKNDKFFLQKR
jgi:hypothetical protein